MHRMSAYAEFGFQPVSRKDFIYGVLDGTVDHKEVMEGPAKKLSIAPATEYGLNHGRKVLDLHIITRY